jgi:hypothetical protein
VVTQQADSHELLDHGVRLGLVVYGVVHLVIAGTSLQMAFGSGASGSASQQGAFAQLAQSPLGGGVLYVMAAGLAALTVWQALEAATGHRRDDGAKRVLKRVVSAGKSVVYAVLGWTAASMAMSGGSSGGSSTDHLTARLMSAPAGQLLVAGVGIGIVVVGGFLCYRGWTEKFTRDLDAGAQRRDRRMPILLLGKVGYLGKGVALAAVGALFVLAAAQHEPRKSGGLDVALHQLLRQPFGPVVVGAVAAGLGCFGLFCLAWARHLDR